MSHPMFKRIATPPFELEFQGKSVCSGYPPFSEAAMALILAASPQNIVQLNPDSFFRFYPDAKEGVEEERVSNIEVILEESSRHFGKLQELGIRIPRYNCVVGKAPDRPKPVIYSLSETIVGTDLEAFLPHDTEHILHDLGVKLFAYYEWVIFNDMPFCLSDIALLRQYMYGRPVRSASENNDAEGTYLIDVEPRVIHNDTAAGRKRVSFELWCLRTWFANLKVGRKLAQHQEILLAKMDLLKLMVNAQAGIK